MLNRFTKGDWIGAYQVESRLRSGGMATLFLARRSGAAGFSRRAAIKVIHPHLSQDERFVRMFVDEARISSRISHPNVVHVEEFGEEGGLFFLVMEYVDGCSASQLLRMLNKEKAKLPVNIAAHIAFKVAEGLHSAHETLDEEGNRLGIVHRDVSPSNVLLSAEGHVKIIDFGIAKARGRIAGTETGYALKGKIRYMSPEQARGKPVDQRSDVYALGVVLWELLAADRAFEAENEFALLEKVRDPQLRKIRDVRKDVPVALEEVISKATSANPDDRPENAYQLSRLIARAVPEALLVDQKEFAALLSKVPQNTKVRDGSIVTSGSGSGTEHSWVSDISTSSKSNSAVRLATGSAPNDGATNVRAPTSTDVFDPSLFVEPTPLPEPAPMPGYNESYDSVEIGDSSSHVVATAPTPWLTTNRTILLGAGLVALGIMAGIIFGSRGHSPREQAPPPAAVAPVTNPAAAPATTQPVIEPSKPAAETSTPAAVAREETKAEPQPTRETTPDDNVRTAAGAAKTTPRKRVRTRTKATKEPEATNEGTDGTNTYDGVSIAKEHDDIPVKDTGRDRPRDKKEEPGRIGKTPIAEGFDD